jgi:monovalent cation:H+ antiporter-2, CPA2 family
VHSIDLILTITGGLAAALVCGYLTHRIGLSPIVGYLAAGLVVGPYTPGYVADQHLAEQLAEIGVILLMFGVGLQFHIEELLAVRRIAIPGAVFQSLVATALGALLAVSAGWSWSAGIVFGIALSVASTVVLIRVLSDNRALHTPAGHIAVGWLVVEDLFTVLVLVLMPATFASGAAAGGNIVLATLMALAKVAVLVAFTFYVGGKVIPWLLTRIASTRSRELFILAVLAIALGIAVGSAKLFGASMALGAFLAGLVVGRSEFSGRAAAEAIPMRDAFAVLFFVSVGMLLDPEHVVREPLFVGLTLAVVLVGKPLAALAITWLFRQPLETGLVVAVALAQIGEFSFIVANLGASLGLLTREATNTIIAAAIVSITLNPLLFRGIDWAVRALTRRGRVTHVDADVAEDAAAARHRAVVVGYGPIGRTVTRLLRENDIEPAVIELNLETVRQLKDEGVDAVYGDASHAITLQEAGVGRASSLILSVAGLSAAAETIRVARELNPGIQVVARTAYLRERELMQAAGADLVFSGEGEVALAVTEALLVRLGATPEQIERERARVHAELG